MNFICRKGSSSHHQAGSSAEKGYFTVPDGPGLGIELDEKVIGQYLAFEVK